MQPPPPDREPPPLPVELDEEALVRRRNVRAEQIVRLEEKLHIEEKIKNGAENLLQLYTMRNDASAVANVQQQLEEVSARIRDLEAQLEELRPPSVNTTHSSSTRYPPFPRERTHHHGGASTSILQQPTALGHTSPSQTSMPVLLPSAASGIAQARRHRQPSTIRMVEVARAGSHAEPLDTTSNAPSTSHEDLAHSETTSVSTLAATVMEMTSVEPTAASMGDSQSIYWQFRQDASERSGDLLTQHHQRQLSVNALRGLVQNIVEFSKRISHTTVDSEHQFSAARMETLQNMIKLMKGNGKLDWQNDQLEQVMENSAPCLADPVQEIRASAFRLFRYLILDLNSATLAWKYPLELFLVRALTRDQRGDIEREQAFKLARVFLDIPGATELIPTSVYSAIVCITQQADDKFRNIAIQTTCEIALRSLPSLLQCRGLGNIFELLVDGPKALVPLITMTIAHLVDKPETRKFIQPAVDVEMMLSNYTDVYNSGKVFDDKIAVSSYALANFFQLFPGMLFLCLDHKRSIRCLVDTLRLPYPNLRRVVVDTLFSIFHVEPPKNLTDLANLPFPAVPTFISDSAGDHLDSSLWSRDRQNFVEHHRAMMLVIFIDTGLFEALVEIIEDSSKTIVIKSTALLGALLDMTSRLLPASYNVQTQTLPRLFKVASSFKDENLRHQATAVLAHIHRLHHNKFKTTVGNDSDPKRGKEMMHGGAAIESDAKQRSDRYRERIKFRMDIQIDDLAFRSLLADTQVLAGKDHLKWNWTSIMELLQGPLMNPKRLEEILRSTKFIKRLLSFYRPRKKKFSAIRIGKSTQRYVEAGCALMRVLVNSADGCRYLCENKLLLEVVLCLYEVGPMKAAAVVASQTATGETVFSKERVKNTLTGEYFLLVGILSRYRDGIEVLEKFKVFNIFYQLADLRNRDDLLQRIVTGLSYSTDGHTRILLAKLMSAGTKNMRLFATNHMQTLLRKNVEEFSRWAIPLLVTQLYDPAMEVCEHAVRVLDEACSQEENLYSLVRSQPILDHLGAIADPLLLRFLSISAGYRYLVDVSYIEEHMEYWFREGNLHYVVQVEQSISRGLSKTWPVTYSRAFANKLAEERVKHHLSVQDHDGYAVSHFYGELTKTEEGCSLLTRKKHFAHFAAVVRRFLHSESSPIDMVRVLELKSVLWAIGNIGATSFGYAFLDDEDVVKDIVELAETSAILSIRGTCFYVLGLIARNPQGVHSLNEQDWHVTKGTVNGLCVPIRPNRFLAVPKWTAETVKPEEDAKAPLEIQDPAEREALQQIGNLSNHILSSASSKTLTRMKQENPSLFTNFELYQKALQIVSVYRYRLPARRFLQDLFDGVPLGQAFAVVK